MAELGCRCQWCEETREAFARIKFTIPGLCAWSGLGEEDAEEMIRLITSLETTFNMMGGKPTWPPTEKSH